MKIDEEKLEELIRRSIQGGGRGPGSPGAGGAE